MSTGPKTAKGKAVVARNAIQHGLLSWKPVIAGFESDQDWDSHYQRTLLDLRPVGHLEIVLAERIALLLWRLGRVARFEREAISTGLEDAENAWNRARGRSDSPLTYIGEQAGEIRRRLELLKKVIDAPDRTRLDSELVAHVLYAAVGAVGIPIAPGTFLEQFADEDRLEDCAWTAGLVRTAMTTIAQAERVSLDELLKGLVTTVQAELDQTLEKLQTQRDDFERFRRRMILADEKTVDRVQRYETMLERAMLRCLHELQRLQASRHGQVVPTPVALDVNLSGNAD